MLLKEISVNEGIDDMFIKNMETIRFKLLTNLTFFEPE